MIEAGYWIARYHDGPRLGDLTIIHLYYEAADPNVPILSELAPVSPFTGLEVSADQRHVTVLGHRAPISPLHALADDNLSPKIEWYPTLTTYKLERRIDPHEALVSSESGTRGELNYVSAVLETIALLVGFERDKDDAHWPAAVIDAVANLVGSGGRTELGHDVLLDALNDAGRTAADDPEAFLRSLIASHRALTAARDENSTFIEQLKSGLRSVLAEASKASSSDLWHHRIKDIIDIATRALERKAP